jgi:hypothetical protein
MKKPPIREKPAHKLKLNDLFWWEGAILRVTKLNPGLRSVEITAVPATERHPKPVVEIFDFSMRCMLATKSDVAQGANCCDGFVHEGCEDPSCFGCPTCRSHHSPAVAGGACCPGLRPQS